MNTLFCLHVFAIETNELFPVNSTCILYTVCLKKFICKYIDSLTFLNFIIFIMFFRTIPDWFYDIKI